VCMCMRVVKVVGGQVGRRVRQSGILLGFQQFEGYAVMYVAMCVKEYRVVS